MHQSQPFPVRRFPNQVAVASSITTALATNLGRRATGNVTLRDPTPGHRVSAFGALLSAFFGVELLGLVGGDDVDQDIAVGEDCRRVDAVCSDAGGMLADSFENLADHHP